MTPLTGLVGQSDRHLATELNSVVSPCAELLAHEFDGLPGIRGEPRIGATSMVKSRSRCFRASIGKARFVAQKSPMRADIREISPSANGEIGWKAEWRFCGMTHAEADLQVALLGQAHLGPLGDGGSAKRGTPTMDRSGNGLTRHPLKAASVIMALVTAVAPSSALEQPNVLSLVMRTPHGGFNRMVVSIMMCEPGTERCATIDDVMVDTGSTGLRLEASAIPPWLRLPAVPGPGGKPLAECLRFVHDTAWGALHRADVRLGGLTASGLPLQVIDDQGGAQPQACPHSDVRPTSNGTLGVGQHLFDCQGACEQRVDAPGVFIQYGAGWSPVEGIVESAYRLPNPVSYLPGHDNGIVIDLPSPPAGGTREVVGTLTFGVDMLADDRGSISGLLRLDAAGRFTTVLADRSFPASYIDSGTETYVLRDEDLPRCRDMAWAYCVRPKRTLDAEMVGSDGTRVPTRFGVGDYQGTRERHVGASDDIAEVADQRSTAFVWGAPFFLGRRIALVIEGRSIPGAPGLVGPFYRLE